MNVILAGLMGSGKTTVGRILSQRLNMNFIDLDDVIVKKTGLSILSIFKSLGESGFRKIEKECLIELITVKNTVIAIGGGTILDNECHQMLSELGIMFFLDTKSQTIFDRLSNDNNKRPLLSELSIENIDRIKNSRKKIYRKIKNRIKTDNKTAEEISYNIEKKVKSKWFLAYIFFVRCLYLSVFFRIIDKFFYISFHILAAISLYKTFTAGTPDYYPYYIFSILFFTILFFMKYGREDQEP